MYSTVLLENYTLIIKRNTQVRILKSHHSETENAKRVLGTYFFLQMKREYSNQSTFLSKEKTVIGF